MTVDGRTIVAKPFLAGQTMRIFFQIVDGTTHIGFQPDTLTMSIYDVSPSAVAVDTVYRITGNVTGPTVSSAIVNSQNDVDVSAFVDPDGLVEVFLTPDDTDVDVPAVLVAHGIQRRILFTWTWGSPSHVGKREIFISLAPDRESVAV